MDSIKDFIWKKADLEKIIIIYGPTACWKTSLSIDLAKKLWTEIISADSRQIYRFLDIWTWKVTKDEMQGITHHMLDIIDPSEEYSVWQFKKEAETLISNISNSWKIPIICWWTWLYLDSLVYNFSMPEIAPNWKLRSELEEMRNKLWNKAIWNKLQSIDPEYAKELSPENYRYVIRWIEVKMMTWESKKTLKKMLPPKYDTLMITPFDWNRELLYENIWKRIDEMFEKWLIDETCSLLDKWYKKDDFWLNTIWYKEVISYLEWETSLEECINLVKQHNRNYAKRQLTWFRKYNENPAL